MKAILLCAGEGTRLRPLTWTTAKPLLPIANTPVIELILTTIREAGIQDIGIVVSPAMEDQFKRYLKDGDRWGLNLSYIVQQHPKGLAHAVQCAREFIGEEPFMVYLGDNLLERGVKGLVEKFKSESSNATISLVKVEDPHRFGVAVLDHGKVKRLVEKPENPLSNLAVVGAYIFDSHIFEAIDKIKPSFRGELEITDAIQEMIEDGLRVSAYKVNGWWRDVGKPEKMLEANRLLLEGLESKINGEIDPNSKVNEPVAVAKGAEITNSKLFGPLMIGSYSLIKDSVLGPYTSIGDEVEIRNSEISSSIVMGGSKIERIKGIQKSLIGKHTQIRLDKGSSDFNSGYSFILGDNSRITMSGKAKEE